jgi:hypothetical protein
MCASGTPLCVLGGPAQVFKRKNQYVVVPLSRYTMQKEHCSFCNPLWDFMGQGIALASPPNPSRKIRKAILPDYLLPHQLILMAYLLLSKDIPY